MTYRIATDGIKFRIEYQYHTIWRNRKRWSHLKNYTDGFCLYGKTYDTEVEAREALAEVIRLETVAIHGWRPVGDPVEVVWTNG